MSGDLTGILANRFLQANHLVRIVTHMLARGHSHMDRYHKGPTTDNFEISECRGVRFIHPKE